MEKIEGVIGVYPAVGHKQVSFVGEKQCTQIELSGAHRPKSATEDHHTFRVYCVQLSKQGQHQLATVWDDLSYRNNAVVDIPVLTCLDLLYMSQNL